MKSLTSALLFGGGICALIYQTVWLREFRLIFGASTPATAAVLALFMGGLGLGGILIGKRAERSPNPLRMYARLELGIAASSAMTPFWLDGVRWLYLQTGGGVSLGYGIATLARLGMAAIVLGIPVVLMGATLPAAARAVTQRNDRGRTSLALLYGANTLGAVLGALSTTFALFEIFGVRATLWMACLLNVLIGIFAHSLSKRPQTTTHSQPADDLSSEDDTAQNRPPNSSTQGPTPILLLSASFLAGFSFFVIELVWYRMSAPILGGSTFTFGLILAIALLGIGLGGLLYSLAPPRRLTSAVLALTFGLEAFAILLPLAIGDELAHLTFFLREFGASSFMKLVLGWTLVVGFLVLPGAIISGYQFPLLVALRGQGPTKVATDVATIYGANTAGSIVGSLLGGFVLLPWLTAPGTWRVIGVLMVLAAMVLILHYVMKQGAERRFLVWVSTLGMVSVGLAQANGPSALWRHAPIGAGRANLHAKSQNEYLHHVVSRNDEVLEEFDGRESSLAFLASNGLAFSVNGKVDGNVIGDSITTVGLGLIPAALHKNPKSALVIGLGSGQTAGWLGKVPSMEQVDVVELEPLMARFAQKCEQSNFDVLQNPRVQILIGDGREVMASRDSRYDLIISEPSNPYRAGIASLYSTDFYRDALDHLDEGGIFGQWLQGYEVHPETFSTVVSTMRAVFAEVSVFTLSPGDFLLVGSTSPMVLETERLRERLGHPPFATALSRVFGVSELEGLLSLHIANGNFSRRVDGGPTQWNTQDLPILEYQFARFVGRTGSRTVPADLWLAASKHGEDRPIVTGAVDWERVREQRGRNFDRLGVSVPQVWTENNPNLQSYLQFFREGNATKAHALLEELPSVRRTDLFERLRRVELRIWVEANETSPEKHQTELDALAAEGVEADVAWLRLLRAKKEKAPSDALLKHAEHAFEWARTDPWVDAERMMRITEEVNKNLDETTAHRLAELLMRAPFASYRLENWRWHWAQDWSERGMPDRVSPICIKANAKHVTWDEQALVRKALCYELNQVDPERLETARAELEAFLANETKMTSWNLETSDE